MRIASRNLLLISAVLAATAAPALADRIELETGEVFTGRILRHNEEEVSIQLATGGVLSFKWSAIRKAKKGSEVLGKKAEAVRPAERVPVKRKGPPPSLHDEPPVRPIAMEDAPRAGSLPAPADSAALPVTQEDAPAARPDENLFTDEERGFAFAPPKSFVRAPENQSAAIPHSFMEPFTRSTFTVAAYPTTDTLLQVKKNTLRSYTERYKVFRVTRDEKLKRDGTEAVPEAWVIEIENRLGNIFVRQVQVLTKDDRNLVLLTYSASGEVFPKLEESIRRSIQSFRFLDAPKDAAAPQETPLPPAEGATGDRP